MTYKKGHKQSNTGRTHWKKGHSPWNKGKSYSNPTARTGWDIECLNCGRRKYFQLNEHKKRERKYCSLACYHEDSRKKELSYSGLHTRILREYGKAEKCEVCGTDKNVDWASRDHSYTLDIKDWIMLCRKHHIAYDKKHDKS